MSTEGPSQRFGASQNPQPVHPYPPEDNSRRMSFQNHPSLPSMSTLLSRPEHMAPENMQPPYPPPQRSFQPQVQETRHILHLSEMNPSAPVQHLYHPPQESGHAPQYRAEPVLVPVQSANRLPARPERVPIPPLAQPRQSKKIGQRRHESERDYIEINKSSVPEQGRSNESDRSNLQDTSPYMKSETDNKPFEPSTHHSTSPRSAPPASVPISNLLMGTSSNLQNYDSKYILKVRQQPMAARACGFGERDRRVIDPPPILQLSIEDSTATPDEISARIRQPFLVVHVTLWDPVTDTDATPMPGTTDKRQQRRLMGTLVSSPFVGEDEFDLEGCFFTFPDLSVRTPGRFSLRFNLCVIDPFAMHQGSKMPVRATIKSAGFDVFNAKDFGGMRASTELTKRLKHQGCLISVKKGNGKTNDAREEDDDDDDLRGDERDMSKPPAKRNKKR